MTPAEVVAALDRTRSTAAVLPPTIRVGSVDVADLAGHQHVSILVGPLGTVDDIDRISDALGIDAEIVPPRVALWPAGGETVTVVADVEHPHPDSHPTGDLMSSSIFDDDTTRRSARGDFAPAWVPEQPGDRLEGQVTEVDTRDGSFGSYVVYTIRSDDGDDVALHAGSVSLRDRLEDVTVGDTIGVAYLGDVRSKNGRSYRNYDVRVRKQTSSAAQPADGEPF